MTLRDNIHQVIRAKCGESVPGLAGTVPRMVELVAHMGLRELHQVTESV